MRKRSRFLVVIATIVITSLWVPMASAHIVSYYNFKTGTMECGGPSPGPGETVVVAKGHHKHLVGSTARYFDTPDDGNWYNSTSGWSVVVATYRLYNQVNRSYSYSSSYGVCY